MSAGDGGGARSANAAERFLRAVLVFIAATHIPIGAALMLSRAAQLELAALYGAAGDFTVREVYLIRILGSCIVVIGTTAAAAARRPAHNAAAIIAIGEFFLLRNLQRHLYAGELYEGFGVSSTVNALTSAVFFALVAALWWAHRQARRGGAPSASVLDTDRSP